MPNGGKGAVAKVYIEAEVIDNFKQQAAKIKTGLGNGLKDLKDLDLNFGFDTEAMAKAAGKELNTIMDLATNKKLNKLDFSGIMPGMISFLNNNEIADELKLQIVQGLRQGLEEFNQTATSIDINNLARRGDGADVWSNLLFSNATKDIVNSLGLKKGDSNIFLKQFGSLTSSSISGDKGSFIQDLSQLLSLKATAEKEEYQDVLKYLVSGKYVDGRGNEQQMFEMSTINDAIRINDFYEKSAQGKLTNKDIKDFAGYVGRLQYLTTVSDDKGLQEIYDSIIKNEHYDELFNNQDSRDEGLSKEQLDLFHSVMDKVLEASKYKDDQYKAIDKQAFNADILQAINALFTAAGDDGTIARLAPLIQGWEQKKPQLSADQLLADTIKSLGLKSEDKGLRQQEGSDDTKRAEAAADRAEQAADRAEEASEEARAIAEDIKGTVEEGTAEASDTSKAGKKSKKKASTQTSSEPVEQIADDAEADAESAEHVVDALEDKKSRLESTIAELENKKKELQGLNDKYQKAISGTFGDIKTPEEALALFKEKATQLQQADKDFAEIVPQRNFTEPKDAKEIAILEEYEKRLAALQQALVEYKKAGETAMDKGVNPADIRANQVDEERLQLNFADSTIDGYIKGLQKAIEDNKKKISEYENLLKTYRGQLEEFTRQGSPSDAKPSGGEQTQSRSAVDTAREETGEVQKSREGLQAEREKLEAEIQNSAQLMNGAEGQIADIDTKIAQVQENHQHNETNISQLTEKKEQIESQIQQIEDELKTIKEKLQDAVDAKQATEEEIRALEEKLLNADGSNIFTADTPENASKYTELKAKRDYADFELNTINQPILDDLLQERQSLEDALNRNYSVKTMDEAYKQAMQRKKEYLEKRKKYAEAIKETDKYEIGSADWMMKMADSQSISAEQDAAWIAYYKTMQEFESHGEDSKSKRTKRERLYSGISSMEMPDEENAELVLSNLQSYLDKLHKQIVDRKKLVELSQKELDELQQKIDELSSHVVAVDDISKQLEQKKQEQQKFKQEEANWTAQQDTKQAELDNLNEQLNGTKGVTNYLKAVQKGQQNNQDELAQLQQQREEQQRIYDEAKAIQEEKQQQLAEIDRMIAEAESREQQAPATTPATTQEKPSAPVSSGQAGEESPVVQNANQQLESLQNEEQQLTDKLAQITEEKNNIEKITQDINDILSKDVSVKTQKEAYNKAQFALIKASTISAERFDDRAPEDKNSSEWIKWFERNKETIQQEKMAWLEYYKAMEEFESHGGETASKIANRRRLQPSDAVKRTREDWGFTSPEDLKQQLEADLQANKELLSSYEQQEQEIQNRINSIQQQKEQLKASNAPLSSSGAETASGVQEEGNEAGDAASKMQALAQAKKEALEANKQLAESANTTTNAIRNESDAGNFDELITKLVEAAKLLAQLPQSFEGFKGFDLEPLKTLSEAIQQLPKEGLNISLGDDFNNLANSIDAVLNKIQELTSEAKTAEIESNIAQKYEEQIKQLKADVEEVKRVIEELKQTEQKATEVERTPTTDVYALIKEYDSLKKIQEGLFTISSADEYSAALEKREEILQRILELEQKVALSDVGQAQIDNLLMGYGDDASSNFSALSEARNTAQKSSIGQLAKEYVEQQKAEIKALADSLSSIDIIPQEAQSNWSKSRKEEYNQIAEGAQAASQAIETLNANLAAMEANGASPEVLKTFLQLKESTAQMVKDTQDKSNVFGESIEAASTRLLDRLSNIETRLQVIKRDSGKLINVDPALAGALETIEKHLNKIQDLKNTVSNDPLQAINPQFTRSVNSYLSQMEGKGKSKSVVEGLEQISDRSQTDFSRLTVNYGKYASALKKLFDDMAQGAKVSMGQLKTDMKRVSYLAEKLSNTTGLGKGELLTEELSAKADPRVADAQRDALDKANAGLEKLQTKIDSTVTSAQDKITNLFGENGISALSESFAGGSVEGFDKFVQSAADADKAMQTLRQAFDDIGQNPSLATQTDKVREINEAMDTLNKSLTDVSNNASKFEIVDKNEIGKLKASTAQFLRSNPNLNIDEISGIKDYLDQLQEGINRTDFSAIQKGIDGIKQSAVEAGHTGGTFVSLLTERFKALGAYLLSFASFYRVIGVFKDGINIIHELDDALTEMQKVSDESLSSLREYQKSTFDTANQIGTTAAQLQTSTADWMRLGEDLQTASQSAQTANVLFNVSEFDNINDATTALVAMSAAYADAEEGIDKMDIVDRLNFIGNNYAIATDELATALQDGAAALQTAGKQHCQNL